MLEELDQFVKGLNLNIARGRYNKQIQEAVRDTNLTPANIETTLKTLAFVAWGYTVTDPGCEGTVSDDIESLRLFFTPRLETDELYARTVLRQGDTVRRPYTFPKYTSGTAYQMAHAIAKLLIAAPEGLLLEVEDGQWYKGPIHERETHQPAAAEELIHHLSRVVLGGGLVAVYEDVLEIRKTYEPVQYWSFV